MVISDAEVSTEIIQVQRKRARNDNCCSQHD